MPIAALACDPGEGVFVTCIIEGGTDILEVCSTAESVRYAFGPPGAPDLTLRVPLVEAAYEPWAGIGRSIGEGVTFANGDFSYVVYAGFDRMSEDEAEDLARHFGGVRVMRGETMIAERVCRPETVDFVWSPPLWDQMEDAGLRWDYADRVWRNAR